MSTKTEAAASEKSGQFVHGRKVTKGTVPVNSPGPSGEVADRLAEIARWKRIEKVRESLRGKVIAVRPLTKKAVRPSEKSGQFLPGAKGKKGKATVNSPEP